MVSLIFESSKSALCKAFVLRLDYRPAPAFRVIQSSKSYFDGTVDEIMKRYDQDNDQKLDEEERVRDQACSCDARTECLFPLRWR